MNDETDSPQAGESLTIDQAAAAYSKSQAPKEVPKDQTAGTEAEESDTPTDDELQASEDVSEEDDGTTADEDQAEEDDEAPESEQGRFVADNARVKLPDGTFTTVADLKAGSLRNADYTQKTQALSEQRKSLDAQSEASKASQKTADDFAAYAVNLVKSIIGTPPDPTLADPNSPNYDPAKYQADEVRFRSWAQHLTYLEQEQQRTSTERQAKTETESKGKLEKEWTTALEKLPELKDPKRLEAFGKDTLKYGALAGYTPQELANIHADHRNLVVMKGYIQWEKLQASKPKVQQKVENRPPVQRGGKRLSPNEARARGASDAIAKAQQSGRLEDVAAAYHASRKGTK